MLGQHRSDGGRQCRLAVVNVTNRTDVHVGLVTLESFLCHVCLPTGVCVVIWLGSGFHGAGGSCNHLVGDALRHYGIVVKLHGIDGATLRDRAHIGRITEHAR